jgi:predicted naringenin-chalcone synthase
LSKIIAIGTAVPAYKHSQDDILGFMQRVYAPDESNRRKLKFLYRQGGINTRYSVLPDYSLPAVGWEFYPASENLEPFPSLEKRMQWFQRSAGQLSQEAAENCLAKTDKKNITHLITVSCTGMSAPGLDIEMLERLKLPLTTNRTAINFMGCYAAIQALKLASAFCKAEPESNVLIICTELCTLHFQKEATIDNITSSMLFGDGSAAVMVSGDKSADGYDLAHFYSSISPKGKADMAWELSSKGFLMTLSGYIADLIKEDFGTMVEGALRSAGMEMHDISQWCIHPGGKKILEAVHSSLGFSNGQLQSCYDVLKEYGNMSSPTVLFVLERILRQQPPGRIFGAAFGPGLTMETFILSR